MQSLPECHPERPKGVEGSSHYDDICSQIGAKILRLRCTLYNSAQDDKLGRLRNKLNFDHNMKKIF